MPFQPEVRLGSLTKAVQVLARACTLEEAVLYCVVSCIIKRGMMYWKFLKRDISHAMTRGERD